MKKYNTHLINTLPILMVLLSFYLKIKGININSLAGDEPFSVYFSQFNFSTIIRELSKGNNPPFFEIILHIWIKIFGISELSVRMLPYFFSSISVFFIFKIGQFFSTKVAIVSSIIFIFSNYQIYFAHEARVYSLFVLLTCISIYAFLNLVSQPKNKIHATIYVLSNILLIYSHFFGFFILFVHFFVSLTIVNLRKVFLKRNVLYLGIVFLLYLPYLSVFIKQFYMSSTGGTWIPPVTNLGQLHDIFLLLINKYTTGYLILLLISWGILQRFINDKISNKYIKYTLILTSIFYLFYSISIMGAMPHYWKFSSNLIVMTSYICFIIALIIYAYCLKSINQYFKIILIWFFVPLLIMFVSSIWVPMFIDRYLIFITPAFYILLVIGIFQLDKKISFSLSMLLICFMIITSTNNVDNKREVRQLVDNIKKIKTNKSIVYICPDYFDLNFTYYYNRKYFKDINENNVNENLRKNLASEMIFPINSFSDIDTNLFKETDKVIYIDAAADFSYSNNNIHKFLVNHLGNYQLYEYPEIFKIYEFNKSKTVYN